MLYRRNQGRPLFLAYVCSAWVAILMAAPLVWALEPSSAGASRASVFHEADANADGRVSPAEAARMPGLSPFYERADANGDGVLDRFEFRRALALRDGR